jgi:hypothetical protein
MPLDLRIKPLERVGRCDLLAMRTWEAGEGEYVVLRFVEKCGELRYLCPEVGDSL